MFSVGEQLQHARLAQGLDLAGIAARTKIRETYLQAIEANDRRSLPSGFFYRSFVDQYARILSLDTAELLAQVDLELSADAPLPLPGRESSVSRNVPPVRIVPRFRPTRSWVSFAVLVAVLAGCSGIYSWWHGKRQVLGNLPRQALPLPQSAQPAPGSMSLASALQPAPVSEAAASGVQAIPGYRVLLDLIAREETWLSVSSDGRRVFSGILAPNQSKTIEGRESATMKVGNAAGLEVHLNGKVLGPLGRRGQVLVVVFTPDNFQIVQPAPREGD